MGTAAKANVGDMDEDVRKGCLGKLRKDIPGVVQEVVEKRIYLVSFQDGGGEGDII